MTLSVTIGLPVFNGEKFIRRSIESVLSQTFRNFRLIISDNNSTDSTREICEEYASVDKRIQIIHQDKNIGGEKNFFHILEHANDEYFVWIAVDDYWAPTFLEKCINILDFDKNIAFAIGKVELAGIVDEDLRSAEDDSFAKKKYKKIRMHYRRNNYYSITGTYEEKIGHCLRMATMLLVYSVFRTKILKELVDDLDINIFDRLVPLLALRNGHLHVIDEILLYRFAGDKTKNAITEYLEHNDTLQNMFFSKVPFIKWCWKNLGKRIFLKNLDYFIKLFLSNTAFVLISIIRYVILRKK
jgi:glycosyltransferase involved in cell wall biosynthesis